MAIDEELIRLQDVPAVVQELRPGSKRFGWSTPYRWCTKGCRGVKLWSVPVAWGRMTNRKSVREFLEQIEALDRPPAAAPETERQITKRQQAAAAQLAAYGW
jgi:hypothetical protein